MMNMIALKSTDVRNQWSSVVDNVVRKKPTFIKRTHDFVFLSNIETMNEILKTYKFKAEKFIEPDNSVTLSLNNVDIAVNDESEELALQSLAEDIFEYANEFYMNFEKYSKAPNRQSHIPYVFKALLLDDTEKVKENIVVCRNGRI